jgi:hypothetical protein
MPSCVSILLNRLKPAEASSRRDRVAIYLIAMLHVVAVIIMGATEGDLVAKAAFLLVWTLLNFFWLALGSPSCRRSADIARACRRAHTAFAFQVRQALDNGRLRRPDDHRLGYRGISAGGLSLATWMDCARGNRHGRAPDCGLATGSVPRAYGRKPDRRVTLHGRPRYPVSVVSHRSAGEFRRSELCFEICAHWRRGNP